MLEMKNLDIFSLDPLSISIVFSHVLATCYGLILILISSPSTLKIDEKDQQEVVKPVSLIDTPLIIPGRISHTRLFPRHHSFSYSYLMVGIPIHSTSQGNGNGLLSVDDERAGWKRGWLRVQANDHLGRGGNEQGIYKKMQAYLEAQVGVEHTASNLSDNIETAV